jgi:hypothetical protein
MAVYHGRRGVVYISTTAAGAASLVLSLTDWSLDMATDTVEVTSFGDVNKTYVQGLPDINGSFSGFWNDSEDKLFTAAASSDGCKIYLYPSADAVSKYFYGPAWLSVSVSTAVGDAVKVTGNFLANGTWKRTPA